MGGKDFLFRYFDTVGDLTGNKEFNIDASVGTTRASIICPTDRLMIITGLRVAISDAGTLDSGNYGNRIALVNGINFILETTDNQLITDFSTLGPSRIKTNGDFIKWFFTVDHISFGAGDEYLSASVTNALFKLSPGQKLSWILEDDFTALSSHTFMASGHTHPDTFKYQQLFKEE